MSHAKKQPPNLDVTGALAGVEVPPGHGLGRILAPDDRDRQFLMESVLPTRKSTLTRRYWNQTGWWGDQGSTPQCVAYAALHYLEDGPVTHNHVRAPMIVPRELYCECQEVDEWYGDCRNPRYNGTSVRAAMKVLQRRGHIGAYRWAFDVDTMIDAVLTTGPVVVGTWWYEGMFDTDSDGFVHLTGRRAGGHAWVVNGVNLKRGVIRAKNSWGRTWGKRGNFWLTIPDMARLISEDGEVALADEIPTLKAA